MFKATKQIFTILRWGLQDVLGDFLNNDDMEVDKSVSLIINYPPYITRDYQDINNYICDIHNEKQMVLVAEKAAKVLNPVGNGHLFLSAYQIYFWVKCLERIKYTVAGLR